MILTIFSSCPTAWLCDASIGVEVDSTAGLQFPLLQSVSMQYIHKLRIGFVNFLLRVGGNKQR